MATLTRKGFALLLLNLDPVADKAAEKYEELQLRLIQYFRLSCGCPQARADALADKTMDRIALKLEQGTRIEKIGAYALATARYIWLEHKDVLREHNLGDELIDVSGQPQVSEESDERYLCLKQCLDTAIKDKADRNIILKYYDATEGEKNKDHRKKLAQSLSIHPGALKVRAFRLRKILEQCIRECLKNEAAL